ncbi:OOP family OmpA-OmpF porin [Parabacteroides sp. PF5-5]|uniref:OmpA family protein n=1 Tax=unclassified Parabacteroides TaxID=2649774 RepID=UPI00247622EE|nr:MULTISPECIES: OmpA family protein [unclassified Parabacteroides]MDH6305778.1 OOP family OmpA-OmpF porin [Parabacteroides sp. PH5-39]MDH6317785.1 OOP family OmpA-OmpF porin [Parabacteroides sp. PF5-13]MDH6320616.1 OOP family OmpA-OmpF porin [Parabacteroides sp. PH5-13]MDH6324221.1 OOP family OmpA-OmpF porin [Parabacteroides sp. PH5-8]MDH6328970.1 OOP family OmpA-OmpF porin [Parabacteroides sp. PH5-41]
MNKFLNLSLFVAFLVSFATVAKSQELPAVAEPGKCYVKCISPDEYKETTEIVVIKPEYKVLKVVPATYKTIEERVLIKEASKKFVYHPAVYETVTETYTSKAGAEELTVVPASFRKSNKTVQVEPQSGRWEYVQLEDCPSANKEDCMVACYVEYPEKNVTVPIEVLNANAITNKNLKPSSTATYKKQVVKTPARVEEIDIPAEYTTIKKVVVDTPARVIEETVPAVTKTITKKELVKKGGITTWEEIDCSIVGTANILPIYYEFNSARITQDSERIIDEYLLKLMKEKPGIRIEIMSHTDSRGNDDYNKSLSQQRAQSVVNYLVNKGISRNRLEAKGYGETRLVNKCSNGVDCSEEEHQRNRRTEFRIIQ